MPADGYGTNRIIIKNYCRKHTCIWPKSYDRTMFFGFFTSILNLSIWNTDLIWLSIDLSVLMYPNLHFCRKSIYHRCTHTMKSSWYLISTLISSEFSTRMKNGHHRLKCWFSCLCMDIYWDTTSVILDGDRPVGMHSNDDIFRMSGHSLIDRVVDNLPYKVMKSSLISRSDIHSWTFTNRFKSFKNLDITTIVWSGRHKLWLNGFDFL